MPTPADIVKIIEPPKPVQKWCGATFIDIKRRTRENQFITDEEKKYCNDFIAAKVKAPEEQQGLLENAIQEAAIADTRYWMQ